MKIKDLILRENFQCIFEITLESFLLSHTGRKHTVKWYDKKVKELQSNQLWFCNPLINSIFVKKFNPDIFSSINGEYSYNPARPFKSLFQKFYLKISQSSIVGLPLARSNITISPPLENAENKLIIGGNNKIRILDITERKVFVILKSGFNKEYLMQDRFVKEKFPYISTPKIIDHGIDDQWFSEEYVLGKPPNRFEDLLGKSILKEAINNLNMLLRNTREEIDLVEYKENLINKIKNCINQLHYIEQPTKNEMNQIIERLSLLLRDSVEKKIALAYCHGDFHQGNILSDAKNFWIVDWEHSGKKQIAYDLFIYLLDRRNEEGFSKRFSVIYDSKLNAFQKDIIKNWPGLNWDNKVQRNIYLYLFLLEDLLFYLKENTNDKIYENKGIFETRISEYKKILEYL